MSKFGWILSFLLLVNLVSACPFDGTRFDSNFIVTDGICENETIFLYNVSGSQRINNITINGNLTIRNSTLIWSEDAESNIIVGDSSNLILSNTTIRGNDFVNLTFLSELNSTVNISDVELFKIYNLQYLSEDSKSHNYIDDLSAPTYDLVDFLITLNNVSASYLRNSDIRIDDFNLILVDDFEMENMDLSSASFDFLIKDSDNVKIDDVFKNAISQITLRNSTVDFYNIDSFFNYTIMENSTLNLFNDKHQNVNILDGLSSVNNYYETTFVFKRNYVNTLLRQVSVNIYDAINLTSTYASGYSDSKGEFKSYLKEYSMNLTDSVYFSNYTINYSKDKYLPSFIEYNATSPKVVEINLTSEKGIVESGEECTLMPYSDFCVDQNPQVSTSCLDMRPGDVCQVKFVVNATDNNNSAMDSTLNNRYFLFFVFLEPKFTEISSIESDYFNLTVLPDVD